MLFRQEAMLVKDSAEIIQSINLIFLLSVIIIIITFAGVFAVHAISNKGISAHVQTLTETMRKLANSDWTTEVHGVRRKDEIGIMANAVEIFKKNGMDAERVRAEQEKGQKRQLDRAKRIETSISDFEKIIADIVNTVSAASTELRTTAESMSATA